MIWLHGRGDSLEGGRSNSVSSPWQIEKVLIVAYPEALYKRWSYGRPIGEPMPAVGSEPVDDIGFIGAMIMCLISDRVADPVRIYVPSSSCGESMTFTLACVPADRLVAVASIPRKRCRGSSVSTSWCDLTETSHY